MFAQSSVAFFKLLIVEIQNDMFIHLSDSSRKMSKIWVQEF